MPEFDRFLLFNKKIKFIALYYLNFINYLSIKYLCLQTIVLQAFFETNYYKKEIIYMKATGIVRRIDDLGRVVIPKEIRRTMRIREGDPLEIYTDSNGEVIFKKYSLVGELSSSASQYCEVLNRSTNLPVVICDRDHAIAVSGISKKEVLDRRVSPELERIMENRESFIASQTEKLIPIEGVDRNALVTCPIIGAGDILGVIIFFSGDNSDVSIPSQTEIKLAQVAASFLGKQMEE